MQVQDTDLSPELVPFIAAAKLAGTADAFILDLLKSSGWSERRIFGAFTAYYGDALSRPVPIRGGRFEHARDAFTYSVAFIALGAWATAVGHLFYVLIDRRFPNTLDSPLLVSLVRQNLSLELATIIVAFPLFAIMSRLIARQLAVRPESADSGVRKWLTSVALVIAAIVMLCDAVVFLQSFLRGDLTERFVLHTVVLFTIVGGIFTYYMQTLRNEPRRPWRDRLYAGFAGALVVAALIGGFGAAGLPQQQRLLDLDERRVDDLVTIANRLHRAKRFENQPLPDTLSSDQNAKDPLTGQPYAYRRIDANRYELCATFGAPASPALYPAFAHQAGRACFVITADTQF